MIAAGPGAEMVPGVGPRRAAAAEPEPELVRAFAPAPDRKRARNRAIAAPPEKERRKAAGEMVGVGALVALTVLHARLPSVAMRVPLAVGRSKITVTAMAKWTATGPGPLTAMSITERAGFTAVAALAKAVAPAVTRVTAFTTAAAVGSKALAAVVASSLGSSRRDHADRKVSFSQAGRE